MPAADYGENLFLDAIIGIGVTKPATLYVAACTAAPTDTSTGSTIVEPTSGQYTGYTRVAVTNNSTNWTNAASGSKSNAVAITFPASTAGTGATLTHYAILDAASGGNLLIYGSLASSRLVSIGDTPRFDVGALVLSAD